MGVHIHNLYLIVQWNYEFALKHHLLKVTISKSYSAWLGMHSLLPTWLTSLFIPSPYGQREVVRVVGKPSTLEREGGGEGGEM